MSEQLPPAGPGPGPQPQGGSPWRTRNPRASVTLRQEGDRDDLGSMMDPATQSLSDALKITYRFVQIAVLALFVFYALSGFRRVHEGERGIRLLFGKVVADDISPGFRFSWPEPFGELVKVRTGAQTISIEDDFFPQLTPDEKKSFRDQGAQALASGGYPKLNPETDGSLVTGDGGIAHTRWAITYHRDDPKLFEENVDPDAEHAMVLAACKRGVIRAVASVSIDELLQNTPDPSRTEPWRPVESVARDIAQKTLDDMESGIRIDLLSMTAKIPPRRVMSAFSQVQSAQAEANRAIQEAGTDRKQILVAASGEAGAAILAQVRLYEKAIELGQDDKAGEILADIDSLMLGRAITVDGTKVNPSVYGKVTNILSEASRDSSTRLANLAGEVERFKAKLGTYRTNPLVLINTEWADAYGAIMASENIQTIFMPVLGTAGRYVLSVNLDPEIGRNIQQARNERLGKEAEDKRRRDLEAARFGAQRDSVIERGTD